MSIARVSTVPSRRPQTLLGGDLRRQGGEGHGEAGEGSDPLAAHGVALVGHGRRPDLRGLHGLLDAPEAVQSG